MTRKLKNCMLPNALESPQAIINTFWLNSTLHFSLRGGKLTERMTLGRCQTQANAQWKRVFVVLGGFYIIKQKLHGPLEIRNFSFRVENISPVRVFFFTIYRPKNHFSSYTSFSLSRNKKIN